MKISKVIFHIKPIPSHPWWECKKGTCWVLRKILWPLTDAKSTPAIRPSRAEQLFASRFMSLQCTTDRAASSRSPASCVRMFRFQACQYIRYIDIYASCIKHSVSRFSLYLTRRLGHTYQARITLSIIITRSLAQSLNNSRAWLPIVKKRTHSIAHLYPISCCPPMTLNAWDVTKYHFSNKSWFSYTKKNSSRNFTQLLVKLGHMNKLEINIWYVTNYYKNIK